MPKRAIYSDKVFKGSLPFAQATIAGGFMFVCCVGRDRAGKFAVGDVRAQTQACLDNIRALIEEAGGTMTRHRQMHGLCHRPRQLAADERRLFLEFRRRPAAPRVLHRLGLGAPECLVEIDATAYLGKD